MFYSHQYGFRDGRIIQQAIIKTSNLIRKAINNEELVPRHIKTFDSIDRNMSSEKLGNAGIRGPILELMKSYLNDRIQRVFVNDTISDSCKVLTVGVLQVSILAALLFLYTSTIFMMQMILT